jgi:hypothetical protein
MGNWEAQGTQVKAKSLTGKTCSQIVCFLLAIFLPSTQLNHQNY